MPAKRDKHIVIYTDGGARPNPGRGGYGVVLLCGERRRELSGGFVLTTNNRMEILAAIVALEALKGPCVVTLHSDSQYLVNAMTKGWVTKWRAKAWMRTKKDKAKNVDLWKRLLAACKPHDVAFKWVRGHVGVPENERCDQLVAAAAKLPDLPIDKGYDAS
jgi:ribonuclease HI